MAKIGYIMAISQYDRLEEDRKWMNDYGCIHIVEDWASPSITSRQVLVRKTLNGHNYGH